MIKLIPSGNMKNSAGVGLLLSKDLIAIFTNQTHHFMFFGESVNWITLKTECLYVQVEHFHFIIFLVCRCKLVYKLLL